MITAKKRFLNIGINLYIFLKALFFIFLLNTSLSFAKDSSNTVYIESDIKGKSVIYVKKSFEDKYSKMTVDVPVILKFDDTEARDIIIEQNFLFFMKRKAIGFNISLPAIYPIKLNSSIVPDYFRIFLLLIFIFAVFIFFILKKSHKNTIIRGRYKALSLIGDGGMASVYKAQDEFCNIFALKIPDKRYYRIPEYHERFCHEAKICYELNHESIVKAFDFCLGDDSEAFILMEYVDGHGLDEELKSPNIRDNILKYAIEIASSLSYIHSKGIIHRDIKPSNIMINSKGSIKISDFGISKSSSMTRITATGAFMGTPSYMAPEQIDGKNADERSDLYSLGAIIYEALSGKPPFEGSDPIKVALKKLFENPTPLNKETGVLKGLDNIAMKLLQMDPNDRYSSAEELLIDLKKIEGE